MTIPSPEQSKQLSMDELESRVYVLEAAGTQVLVAIWKQIQAGNLSERGPIADSALVLRDALNPDWPNNSNWLPEELKS